MRLFTLQCAMLLVLTCTFANAEIRSTEVPQSRIINGQSATQDYGFFVTLMTQYEWAPGKYHWNPVCGGSYIGAGTVVTAAHCVIPSEVEKYALLVGDYTAQMEYEYCSDEPGAADYSCVTRASKGECVAGFHYTGFVVFRGDEGQLLRAASAFRHQSYSSRQHTNDIALIQLETSPTSSAINLPQSTDEFASLAASSDGKSVRVLGHGDTLSDLDGETFEGSASLREVNITPRTDDVCKLAESLFNSTNMVCAGDPGLDSSNGDSGGPRFNPRTNTLLGVVSFGPSYCGSSEPDKYGYGVYSDVFAFKEWISDEVIEIRSANPAAPRNLAPLDPPQMDAPRGAAQRVALTNSCEVTVATVATDGTIDRLGNEGSNAGSLSLWLFLTSVGLLWRQRR
jgi:secreted trypsin-like serine protease